MAISQRRTVLPEVIPEGVTSRITGTLVDETGAPLGSSQVTALTMTLYAVDASLSIINSRSATNILNTGPGTLDVSGNLVITLTPADNDVVGTAPGHEKHRLLLEWAYGGTKAGKHEIEFAVCNLDKVA